MIAQKERYVVLLELAQAEHSLDVLNRHAVDDFAELTGADIEVMPYGANKCRRMGRDLSAMAKQGLLLRHRTGIDGLAGMGFPRWVWSYCITDKGRDMMRANQKEKTS